MFAAILLTGGLVLSAGEAQSPAQDAAADALALEVRKLIRQLDSPQLSKRDAAEEQLLRLGPAILDLLPAEFDPSQAEAAQRVARLRQKLQRAQAESSIQPSTVTLKGRMPLSKALAEISRQTGNKIEDARREAVADAPDPEVNADFDKTPFWPALDKLLEQTGLTIYPYADTRAVQVVFQPGEPRLPGKRAACVGPFRIEPVSVTAERDLRRPSAGSMKLEVEIVWEPRVQPISLVQRIADLKAVDEKGNAMAFQTEAASLEAGGDRGPIARRLFIPFALPSRDVTRIARLSGRLRAVLPGKEETFRFADLDRVKKAEKRAAGVTVAVQDVMENNKAWEVFLHVRFDNPGDALASHRTWVFDNPAWLEGPDGKRIDYLSYESTDQTENLVGVGYLFGVDKLAGHTFVYKTSTAIVTVPVDFEFRDIPLP